MQSWFSDDKISVKELIGKTDANKTRRFFRIAYQTPEEGSVHCARSYEDALILANLDHFQIIDDKDAASNAWEKAQGFRKSEEAIRFAITEADWNVPKYIREGLVWLSEPPPPPDAAPPIIPAESVEETA